ncbi:MAG: hypothetical protein AABZ33_03500 [Chloroflexota bacterium]
MNTPRDPDEILSAWLDEGPARLPDQTRRAIVVALPSVTQRWRLSWVPWRFPLMTNTMRAAAGIAIVAIVGVAGLNFLRPAVGPGSAPSQTPTPTATPEPSPTQMAQPSAIAAPIPSLTETFDSANGYSIGIGASMTVEKTDAPWGLPDAFDAIVSSLYLLRVGSDVIPDGVDVDAWIQTRLTQGTPGNCGAIRAELPEVVIDGHAGKIRDSCGEIEATVVAGGRAYLFTFWMPEVPLANGREIFDAFAATVQLRPEDVLTP